YLYKYPFKLAWYTANLLRRNRQISFYCADPLDYDMFLPIMKYLPPDVSIIAKNSKTKEYLRQKNVPYINMPSFPNIVIMARQTPYKFPVNKIVKIGFDHGLYQFKRWTSPKNYNGFDVYFVSSSDQVRIANSMGINTVKAIGYPKLDKAFNGTVNAEQLLSFKNELGIDSNKGTLLFTTTWDVANLSVIEKWIDQLDKLSMKYNILVTVHTWTKDKYKQKLRLNKNIIFIEEMDATNYLMISDVLIGDYSSIIGEFCAFNKPIITFKVPDSDRTIPEIQSLLKNISIQINNFEELENAITFSFENPNDKAAERESANKILFYALDGQAGKRAAEEIKSFL
ncbi:MAG: CDP-glycerol glycerophosphotransferase family protein, partial [Melioribacteraceae bacterium]|nr:CDP-glycerol glycerophosphotransferase family protein [Melioribacteraceae bacterium]